MWGLFAGDVLLSAVILFIPGFFFSRSFRLSRIESFCVAPFLSTLMVLLLSFAYSKVGIEASFLTLFLPIMLVSLLCFGLSKAVLRSRSTNDGHLCYWDGDNKALLVYIVVAVVVTAYVFVKTLDGAASFNQQYDNYSHLNAIRGFIDSGVYAYEGLFQYPFAWYAIAAMVANAGAAEVTVAVNALNFVIFALVWPAGVYAFLSRLSPSCRLLVLCGALCCIGFVEFPWGLLAFGPLYPNAFSYAALPAVLAMYIALLNSESAREALTRCFLLLVGCASLVFMHPNAIFVGIVLLSPFTVSFFLSRKWPAFRKLACSSAFVVSVWLVWNILYSSSAFHGVVSFEWPAYISSSEAVGGVLSYCLTKNSLPQIAMAVLVFVGCCVCFVKKRNRWMVVSLLVSAVILVVAASSEGDAKHLLAGFWYTDTFRIAAMVVIASIPLASIGLESTLLTVKRQFEALAFSDKDAKSYSLCLLLFLSLCVFLPNTQYLETPFGKMRELLGAFNSQSTDAVYEQSEIDFVEKAKEVVPAGSAVANIPFDGSYLSYGVNDFKVMYSNLEAPAYWKEGVDEEGKLIRSDLCDYAMNAEVRKAVEDQGVAYVLVLDQDDREGERMDQCAKDLNAWKGIMEITDETEGFEIVLSEGDMRLYRLTEV